MLTIKRTTARFGKVNPRVEMHGDDKVNASDISVTIPMSAEIIPDLVMDHGFAGYLHNENGTVRVPAISPFTVHRSMEGMKVTIYDNPKDPLKLSNVTLKEPTITLVPNHGVEVSMKLQAKYGPGQLERMANLMQNTADIQIEATQNELVFDDEAQTKGKKKQSPVEEQTEPKAAAIKKKAASKKTTPKKELH